MGRPGAGENHLINSVRLLLLQQASDLKSQTGAVANAEYVERLAIRQVVAHSDSLWPSVVHSTAVLGEMTTARLTHSSPTSTMKVA